MDVRDAQQLGALLEVLHLDGGGDESHQEVEVVDALEGADGFLGCEGGGFHNEGGLFLEGIGQHAQFAFVGILRDVLFQEIHARGNIGVVAHHAHQPGQGRALQDGGDGAVRHLQGLDELAHGAPLAQVFLHGVFHGDVHLGNGHQPAVAFLYVGHQLDGLFPSHGDRENGAGEHDGVAQGQDGHHRRQLGYIHFHGRGFSDDRHYIHFYARGGVKI